MGVEITQEQMYNFVSKYYESLPNIENTKFRKGWLGYILTWEENKHEHEAHFYTMITASSMGTDNPVGRAHLDIFGNEGKKCRNFKYKSLEKLGIYI